MIDGSPSRASQSSKLSNGSGTSVYFGDSADVVRQSRSSAIGLIDRKPAAERDHKEITGEAVIEIIWTPQGASRIDPSFPLWMSPQGFPASFAETEREVLVGTLLITIRSASNLQKSKSWTGGASCNAFVKVHVPRTPVSYCGSKPFQDDEAHWRLPTVKHTSDPVWNEKSEFNILWLEQYTGERKFSGDQLCTRSRLQTEQQFRSMKNHRM